MSRSKPLVPRNGHTLQTLIVARISGCQNQKELSLEDQVDHGKQEVADLYAGPCEFRVIATKGKGERLDRPELAEVEELVRSGVFDLVIMEDVGRLVRGTAAVELWGMAVDNGTRCIAPHDGCDTDDETWEEDLISACKDHVSHCSQTSRRIKHKQMNRFKRNGGAVPLPSYGVIKPQGAKFYSEWRKDDSATPILRKGLDILKKTKSWTAVAADFNRNSVPTGPYCRKDKWDGAMVCRLYHNPILKGMPQRGARRSEKQNQTGRRISVVNPAGPTFRHEPHLAHFDPAELDAVLAEVDAHHARLGRPKDSSDGRVRNNRKRTRFPGQCATCYYCGREMVWGGNGIPDHLMCNGSRHYQCWNSLGFSGQMAAQRILEAITAELSQLDGFEEQFSELIHKALADREHDHRHWQDLQAAESQCDQDKAQLKSAILQSGSQPLLNEMLIDLQNRECDLARRRQVLENQSRQRPKLPEKGAELRAQFEEVSRDLALHSFEFGDLLRSLVTEFHVYVVQLIDGGHLLPRAKIKLSLGGIVRDIDRAPELQEFLTREITIDLFDPPIREQIRTEVARQSAEHIKQRDIAASLNTHQATVQRALKLDRLMRERGLTSPYELVTAPPPVETNRKLKRSRHDRYSFLPREGYEPPPL